MIVKLYHENHRRISGKNIKQLLKRNTPGVLLNMAKSKLES